MLKDYLKRGSRNTICFGLTSILAKGMWLLCMPYILHLLSTQDIGIFDFYQSIFLIGSLVIAAVSSLPLGRFYLKYRNQPELQRETIGTSMRLVLFCALLCLGIAALAAVRYTLYGDSYFVIFLMVNAGLFSCFSLVTSFAQIRERLSEYMILYCAQNFFALSLALICLRSGYGISSLFWANGISYLLCIPFFIKLFYRAGSFMQILAREQLQYGLPLMAYNVLYMLLFAVDRWYLKATFGYELLGLYAVLWYFGRIFQYAAMSLYDASPMLFYNAQHEHEGTAIITRVMRYATIVYATGALVVVPFAYCTLTYFLPKYIHLSGYLPFFIMPLFMLETGRFWQHGFTLATKTRWIPFISLCTLLIQLTGLYLVGPLGLPGVMAVNTVAFTAYLIMNAIGSSMVYSKALFDIKRLVTLLGCYGFYNLMIWYAMLSYLPILSMFCLIASWPATLWVSGVLADDEKQKILQIFKKTCIVST